MKRMTAAVAALGLFLGIGACGDDDAGERLTVATELADTWGQGWDDNDPEAVASVFTEDGQYLSFDGNTYEGDEIAEHVRIMGGAVTDLVRTEDLTETPEGTFTWVVETDLFDVRYRGTPEMELDGDLISRLSWAEDPVPID